MKLFSKIFLYSLALFLFPLLVVAWLSHQQIGSEVEARTYQALEENVTLLAPIARNAWKNSEEFQERVRSLDPRTRFTVIRSNGDVLADSWKDPTAMENHATRPEFVAARTHEFGYAARHSATVGRDMFYVATRFDVDGQPVGMVRAAVPREDVAARSAALREWLFLAFWVSLAGGTLLALFIARRRAQTLRRMSAAAQAIAGGDFRNRMSGLPSDELGGLGRSFNQMASHLESRLDGITKERRRLTTVLAGMVEGVIAVDADERIVHCNEAARTILDLGDVSPIQRPVWEVVRLPQVAAALHKTVETRAPVTTETTVARDGQVRNLQLHAAPLREPLASDAEVAGAVLVVHDITDVRKLEKVRRDFIANASHELKTPVAAIRGIVETIVDDEDMSQADRVRFLGRVLTQSGRLQNLIEEMLALSRLEAASGTDPLEELDLRDPVIEACEAIGPLANEKRIAFSRQIPEHEVLVRGSSEAIRRIAANLLDNAVKYTPTGGQVDLTVAVEDAWVVLRVDDTGIGIPAAKKDRVFERFFRIDDGRAREVGGSGLGLAIVKHLVIALGGEVLLEPRDGQGSRFIVRIPRVVPEPA